MHTGAIESGIVAAQLQLNNPAAASDQARIDITDLFCAHRQNLIRFVRRYVRTAEDAEDVVQNTFLEAIRCSDRFAGLSKPSTWLYGIALNLARNQVRRNCACLSDSVEDSTLEQFAEEGVDPSELTERRQMASMVHSVLGELSSDIRETFEAVLGEECTYKQAAAILQIPLGTVRSRISRVRSTIRSRVLNASYAQRAGH